SLLDWMTVNGTNGRKRQLRPRRVGGRAARSGVVALAIACLVAAAPAGASEEHSVTVQPRPIWTLTGITVHKGDTITVTASGKIHFGGGPISSLDPNGIPWGPACRRVNPRQSGIAWPANGIACWSLIARIDAKQPIVGIGTDKTFTAAHDGQLELGVNDNFVVDNSGSWDAKVTVTPVGGVPPAKSSGGSSALIFLLLGAVLLLAVVLLFF